MTEKKETQVGVTRSETAAPPAATADWEPFTALRHQFDRLMEEFDWPDVRFNPSRGLPRRALAALAAGLPAVDLVERDGSYELSVELPGIPPEAIEVKLSDGMLTVRGEKSDARTEEKGDYHLKERSFGVVQRSFRLPPGIDGAKVEAHFANGVLKIGLPKSASALEKERRIKVKAA